MDGIANVAKQQQTQVSSQESQGKTLEQIQQTQQVQEVKDQQTNIVKELQDSSSTSEKKINSKEEVEDLVQKLNEVMSPISTNIKFGVDQNDIFYVSVIEAKTNKIIRRFPAEHAQDFLPKMKEVTGILFDSKG